MVVVPHGVSVHFQYIAYLGKWYTLCAQVSYQSFFAVKFVGFL